MIRVRKEIYTVSYTESGIGSGRYCECGHELTHEELNSKITEHKCLEKERT